jgi:hypothetical protein
MIKEARKELNTSGKEECQRCHEPEILIEHHINCRDFNDYDKPWNKCYICANCHNKVHFGRILIEGWFRTTNGLELIWRHIGEESKTGAVTTPPLYTDSKDLT